ncbi:MAG: homoserine dehydrogenase [Clostridia bacterium]|nr:homoserine dehydrogenase [Clostridia bacterium]
MVNVAIMGHGVVGSGVAEILIKNSNIVANNAQTQINIKHILDLRDFESLPYSNKFTKDFNDILNDTEVDIVAEAMGGLTPAYDFVLACLKAGKSVVTSNKELVAAKGAELLKTAKENNVNFLFEASVGGGIPVIRPMAQCLAANEITEIFGILNGTTNFILTKMICENLSFESALSIAQEKGYAEKNPDADVLGHDACRKIAILASLGFGKHIYPDQVFTKGITEISLDDVDYADKLGYVIKLIGHAKKLEKKVAATVFPALVSKNNMLAGVNDVYNAVVVRGNMVEDVLFYGRGAGKLPTASAVVADIIDCAKHLKTRKQIFWEDTTENIVEAKENLVTQLFVRIKGNSENVCIKAKELFNPNIQLIKNSVADEVVFITSPDTEKVLINKLQSLENCKIESIINLI